MLFQILPLTLARPRLTELSVEMIAVILRYLDQESLLNIVKTYEKCLEVSLGDPILRRRLKMSIKEKKKQEMEMLLNAALSITVTRKEPGRMFNTNVIKSIKKKVTPKLNSSTDTLGDLLKYKKKTVELLKVKTCNRTNSYRL